jgi:hypothetical protein
MIRKELKFTFRSQIYRTGNRIPHLISWYCTFFHSVLQKCCHVFRGVRDLQAGVALMTGFISHLYTHGAAIVVWRLTAAEICLLLCCVATSEAWLLFLLLRALLSNELWTLVLLLLCACLEAPRFNSSRIGETRHNINRLIYYIKIYRKVANWNEYGPYFNYSEAVDTYSSCVWTTVYEFPI